MRYAKSQRSHLENVYAPGLESRSGNQQPWQDFCGFPQLFKQVLGHFFK